MTHFRRYGYAVLTGLAMLLALAPTGIAAAGTPAGSSRRALAAPAGWIAAELPAVVPAPSGVRTGPFRP